MGKKILGSIEHISDSGEVKANCGHLVDVRLIVYIHYPDKTATSCPKCSKDLPDYKGRIK